MSWTARMVEDLLVSKQDGVPFAWAWSDALARNPPRGRDCGPVRPTLLDADESLVDFTRRVAEDAWHGRKPLLAHVPSLLAMVADDGVLAAQPKRRMTMVA